MDIKFLICEALAVIIMVLVIIYTKNFFIYYRCESKGLKWNNLKKLKKIKTDGDKIRLMVSLSNGTVMFDVYDPEKGEFTVPDVEAWRYPPPCYKDYMKIIRNMKFKRGDK